MEQKALHTTLKFSPVKIALLKTFLYFDIFHYPLTRNEVFQFCSVPIDDEDQFNMDLEELTAEGYLFRLGDFYSIRNDKDLAQRRIKGNLLAKVRMKLAKRISRFIGQFPFVRGVMLSGSISKNYMEPQSDIDYFIVTAPGRLWIARTLLVMFKRLFLFNSHKYFCVNYFVDTQHNEIEEQNLFTATELATLIPTVGKEPYLSLMNNNSWYTKYYPQMNGNGVDHIKSEPRGLIKKVFEYVLNNFCGERLDQRLMRITLKFWQNNYHELHQGKDFEIAFKTRRYVSKNHPKHYQKKVIESHQERIRAFELTHNLEISNHE